MAASLNSHQIMVDFMNVAVALSAGWTFTNASGAIKWGTTSCP
jgi:hypothetical protein